jgi:hypothetical protein
MKGLIAFCALTLMAWTGTDAHAEMFKCMKNGRPSFQETPCAAGEAESRIGTARPSGWEGCYEVTFSRWEGGPKPPETMQVRRDSGGLVLDFRGTEKITFPLRPVTDEELKNMQRSMKDSGSTVLAGIGIRSHLDDDPEIAKYSKPPAGIYTAKDEKGKDVMFMLMPFSVGPVKKMPCG